MPAETRHIQQVVMDILKKQPLAGIGIPVHLYIQAPASARSDSGSPVSHGAAAPLLTGGLTGVAAPYDTGLPPRYLRGYRLMR